MLQSNSRFPGFLLCLLCLLCFPGPAQQPLADAADISRELLYHPARRIEAAAERVVFRAAEFTYRFDLSSSQWDVAREKNFTPAEAGLPVQRYRSTRTGEEYRFVKKPADDEGILEIYRGDAAEPAARLVLWNRAQLADAWLAILRQDTPGLTSETLAKDLEAADPEVAGVAEDATGLWLAIRSYAGEGSLGLGTIVRFDPQTSQAKVYQPAALATSSVTHIATTNQGALWLGTHRQGEGAVYATQGLVRFDPAAGETRSFLPESSAMAGRIVTALQAAGQTLWVATDAGVCRVALPAMNWTCWRVVPTVRLAEPAAVSNRPGAPSGGRLPAGRYEVLWANTAFFEVATQDWIEGWIAADDLQDAVQRRFDTDPYELGNGSYSGIAPMRLVAKPGGDPLQGAVVYRAPLERVGSATAEGWQRVRARSGWISRKGLDVAPVVQPISH